MLVVKKGKCIVPISNPHRMEQVYGVHHNGNRVFFSTHHGVTIGRYIKAYFQIGDNYCPFGEIKFTVGTIVNGQFLGNYVLCEY